MQLNVLTLTSGCQCFKDCYEFLPSSEGGCCPCCADGKWRVSAHESARNHADAAVEKRSRLRFVLFSCGVIMFSLTRSLRVGYTLALGVIVVALLSQPAPVKAQRARIAPMLPMVTSYMQTGMMGMGGGIMQARQMIQMGGMSMGMMMMGGGMMGMGGMNMMGFAGKGMGGFNGKKAL